MKLQDKLLIPFLVIWPFLAFFLSFLLNLNTLNSIVVFYLLPCLIFFVKFRKLNKSVLIFSLAMAILAVFLDAWAHFNHAWFITTIFPFRILGSPLELLIWSFLVVYFIVIFYEFIADEKTKAKFSPKLKYLFLIFGVLLIAFAIIFFVSPNLLKVSYLYLITGTLFLFIPPVLFLIKRTDLIKNFTITGAYFFVFHFLYEIFLLKKQLISYPETNGFIGWVTTFGVKFPLEELLFFFVFFAVAVLTYYKYFLKNK